MRSDPSWRETSKAGRAILKYGPKRLELKMVNRKPFRRSRHQATHDESELAPETLKERSEGPAGGRIWHRRVVYAGLTVGSAPLDQLQLLP